MSIVSRKVHNLAYGPSVVIYTMHEVWLAGYGGNVCLAQGGPGTYVHLVDGHVSVDAGTLRQSLNLDGEPPCARATTNLRSGHPKHCYSTKLSTVCRAESRCRCRQLVRFPRQLHLDCSGTAPTDQLLQSGSAAAVLEHYSITRGEGEQSASSAG